MKSLIQIALWAIIGILGYMLFNSINEPIQFNKIKEKRYAIVIESLKDIRSAQLAHKEVTGRFADNFDSLVAFVEHGEYAITQRRDTSFADVKKNRAYGLKDAYFINETLIDTLGYQSVKDSLFKGDDRYKRMMYVPIKGVDAKFELKADTIMRNDLILYVFEARVSKAIVLSGQPKHLILQQNDVASVEDVDGTHISVGSLREVNTTGNWPRLYDTKKQ